MSKLLLAGVLLMATIGVYAGLRYFSGDSQVPAVIPAVPPLPPDVSWQPKWPVDQREKWHEFHTEKRPVPAVSP